MRISKKKAVGKRKTSKKEKKTEEAAEGTEEERACKLTLTAQQGACVDRGER